MAEDISADRLKQAGDDRLDDAKTLERTRPNGAVYLAGYTIECWLKAAILKGMGVTSSDKIDPDKHKFFFNHKYRDLTKCFGVFIPNQVKVALDSLPPGVFNWDPQWRYNRPNKDQNDSAEFIKQAESFRNKVRGST